MPKLCISYRRADSAAIAGRILDRLVAHYGKESIFIDIDNIPVGSDFREHLDSVLRQADVMLALVGTQWLGARETALPRIHDERDPVRVEVQIALEAEVPIIPVLIDGSKMPDETELPQSLREFAYRNATDLGSGRDFDVHMERLIRSIDRILAEQGKNSAATSPGPATSDVAAAESAAAGARVPYLVRYLAAPVVLLLVAHYLIVMKLDLNTVYLRFLAIVIPFAVGILLFRQDRHGIGPSLALGATMAVVTVIGMLVVVGLVDATAILPRRRSSGRNRPNTFSSSRWQPLQGTCWPVCFS